MPGVRKGRSLDTFTDEEFGRQLVAGQHPCVIKAATADWLKGMPLTDADVEGLLEGESLTARLEEGGRMFCVDYVAGFLDYMDRIDNQNKETESEPLRPDFLKKDRKQHAGRALLYYTNEGFLKPVAIQLISDPQDVKGTVYTPNDPTELWTLAKAIFGNLDFLYHQVVSHYLMGHACQEPFIIALMRNVSAMHPVFKLMRPHFRYTLHVNAFGRIVLINPGTPIEASLTPGQYGMRLCSFVYDKVYNFEKANFETDLITRGMVEFKDGQPVRDNGHLKPVIDYPFAEDGLDVWYAMQDWFGSYLGLYYDNNVDGKRVTEDPEIMKFWDELQSHGHPDKKEGWPKLTDIDSLRDILTTIAFNGSVHHSAVNFGNYDYSAWSPNRPSLVRKAIPKKDETDKIEDLKLNYEQEFLSYLTQPADAMQIATVFRILSTHAENEEYLDSDKPEWIQDPKALTALSTFVAAMNKLDADITTRNSNPVNKMRSNPGCRGRPYELLRPHSGAGPTGMGLPYSTTI